MARSEAHRGCAERNPVFIHSAEPDRLRPLAGAAIARTNDAVADIHGAPVEVKVDELRRPVGRTGGCCRKQEHRDPADYIDIFLERCRGIDEHIIANLDGALIETADWRHICAAARSSPDARYRLARIVDEDIGRLLARWLGSEHAIVELRPGR